MPSVSGCRNTRRGTSAQRGTSNLAQPAHARLAAALPSVDLRDAMKAGYSARWTMVGDWARRPANRVGAQKLYACSSKHSGCSVRSRKRETVGDCTAEPQVPRRSSVDDVGLLRHEALQSVRQAGQITVGLSHVTRHTTRSGEEFLYWTRNVSTVLVRCHDGVAVGVCCRLQG